MCKPLGYAGSLLSRLLSQGLKVGIVEQIETAALKKLGDTRNELFERKLTNLFTAATYVTFKKLLFILNAYEQSLALSINWALPMIQIQLLHLH